MSGILHVDVGDGAVQSMPDHYGEGSVSLEYVLRYGKPSPEQILCVASLLESYDYLISGCSEKEAIRRLQILRKVRNQLSIQDHAK